MPLWRGLCSWETDNIALSGAELSVQGGEWCRERPVFLTVPCTVTRGFEVSQEGTLPLPPTC